MNGLTGRKMKKIFEALMSKPANNEARNLVEYCCFRFLSRDNSDIHPCLEVCVICFLHLGECGKLFALFWKCAPL